MKKVQLVITSEQRHLKIVNHHGCDGKWETERLTMESREGRRNLASALECQHWEVATVRHIVIHASSVAKCGC